MADLRDRICVVSAALTGHDLTDALAALDAVAVRDLELSIGPGGHLALDTAGGGRTVGKQLRDNGFRLRGLDAPGSWPLGDPMLARVGELAAELAAPFVRVYPPAFDPGESLAGQFGRAGADLAAVAAAMPEATAVLLEPAPGTLAPSPELAARLVTAAATPACGVIFDPGSGVGEGHLSPELAFAVLGELLQHVHVKNRALTRRGAGWISAPRRLADGVVDWVCVLRALVGRGYPGWLSIDHLSGPATPECLARDVADLRELVTHAAGEAGRAGAR